MSESIIAVGKRLDPAVGQWPEMVQFHYSAEGYQLLIFWKSPSKDEITGVRRGKIELATFSDEEAFLMLYKIENACNWSYTPFDWYRMPQSIRLKPADDHLKAEMEVILVDANNGIVRVIRKVPLTQAFIDAIHQGVELQISQGTTWLDDRLQRLYKEYFTPESFLKSPQSVSLYPQTA